MKAAHCVDERYVVLHFLRHACGGRHGRRFCASSRSTPYRRKMSRMPRAGLGDPENLDGMAFNLE